MKQQNLIVELVQRNAIDPVTTQGSTEDLIKTIEEKTKQLAELETKIGAKDVDITALKKEIADTRAEVLARVSKEAYDALQARYDRDINFRTEIDTMETKLTGSIDTGLTKVTNSVTELKDVIEANSLVMELNQQLRESQAQVQTLNTQLTSLHSENASVRMQLTNAQNRIALLESQQQTPEDAANMSFLVQKYKNVTLDEFYAMYNKSAAMKELGLYVTPFEYNVILGFFLSKLRKIKEFTGADFTNMRSTYMKTFENISYVRSGTTYTNGKGMININEFSADTELNRTGWYLVQVPDRITNEEFTEYLRSQNYMPKFQLRMDISSYGLKYIMLEQAAGNYLGRSGKTEWKYYFELNDGTFTNKKDINTLETTNKYGPKIHPRLTYIFTEVPENAVAVITEITAPTYWAGSTNANMLGVSHLYGI